MVLTGNMENSKRNEEIVTHESNIHESVSLWITSSDMSSYGDSFVLMRELFYDYIYFCKKNGIAYICTDREFSKSLQNAGFEMDYKRKGTYFRVNDKK